VSDGVTTGDTEPQPRSKRRAARVLLIDPEGRVLLFRGGDPSRPHAGTWWFTAGGGIDGSERVEDAARREVREETGLELGDLGPVVLERVITFEMEGNRYEQHEVFFAVTVEAFEVDDGEWTDLERRIVEEYRWWARADLAATTETIFPDGLADLLDEIDRARAGEPPRH
jgi:8-oxo-dGTP pyrophosphatase MutT (NUDIX family)